MYLGGELMIKSSRKFMPEQNSIW